MPVHPYFDPDHLYLVTTKAERHAHLFQRESIIRILLDSLHFLRTDGRLLLFVFVIMPNHIHFIARFSRNYTLADMMRDFKRHTARQIIRQLQAEDKRETLDLLHGFNKDTR